MTKISIISIVPFLILSGASASISSNMLNNAKHLRGSPMSNDASGVARRVLLESQSISFISSDHKQILGLCEGDCDSDEDCGPGLTCFQRDGLQDVPGCSGSTADFSGYDFCYSHVSTYGPLEFKGENPSLALGPCQGDCDSDADCADGLVCYQRRSSFAGGLIPGCSIETHEFDGEDFCYDPSQGIDSSTPTAPVAPPPVASPVAAPTPVPIAPTKAPVPSPTQAPVAPTQAPVAPTLSPVAPTQAPVAPTLPPFSGPDFVLDLTLDYWPGETRWEVVDKCNGDAIVFHGGPYTATHRNAIISETASIEMSRYEFRIYDSYGDGMSVRTGDPGGFVVKFYGSEVGSGSGNFGSQKTLFFGNNSC